MAILVCVMMTGQNVYGAENAGNGIDSNYAGDDVYGNDYVGDDVYGSDYVGDDVYGESFELQIIAAATDETHVVGGGANVVIKCNGAYADFVDVAVDGVILDSACYTVEEGSTVLTLLSSYLDTLSVGNHVVTLNYTYGSVDTDLTVIDNAAVPNIPENNETSISGNDANAVQNDLTQDGAGVPKTGDNSLMIWMVITVIAGSGLLTLVWTRKRQIV